MGRIIACMAVLLCWTVPALADTYTWTDKSGVINFSDNYSSIPKAYRKKARRLGDMSAEPAQPVAAKNSAPSPGLSKTGDKAQAPANDLYAGKQGKEWQKELRERAANYKQLENELLELEKLLKEPGGLAIERVQRLPAEFRDTQSRYNAAIKAYNDLNDAANKAELPAEFRK